jgi:hypothetical protein
VSSIRFTSFPRTLPPPDLVTGVIEVFRRHESQIATEKRKTGLKSDEVLNILRPCLEKMGFMVESGKSSDGKIIRPVFFGENGEPSKTYAVDAFFEHHRCGLEVEAGRAIGGNAIYRDLIQAMVMVNLDLLLLAVPNVYRYGKTKTHDYESTLKVADALFGHTRMTMPYRLVVIGY